MDSSSLTDPAEPTVMSKKPKLRISDRGWTFLELGLIFLAVWVFCSAFLDLGEQTRLPGNEAGLVQAQDYVFYNALRDTGKFPLWNADLRTGVPFIADPLLHVYDPLVWLPVILLGVLDGFKLALFLSFLAAALGMWFLGRTLGMSRPTRLWMALMFAFAGQPVARFFQGQYTFVLGFAWIPWFIAGLFLALRTQRRLHYALAALALGLLLVSGNIYYAFYMLITALLFAVVMLFDFQTAKPRLVLRKAQALSILWVLILAFGLAAVQILPLAQAWTKVNAPPDVPGAHTFKQILLDYTSKNTTRPDAWQLLPAREEFYAYIGWLPFLALLLLPLAFWRGEKRSLIFFLLLFLFALLWGSLPLLPGGSRLADLPALLPFRYLLRALVIGSFALLVLAGLGIDTAWKLLLQSRQAGPSNRLAQLRDYLSQIGLILLGGAMLLGVFDLYSTHRPYVKTQADNRAVYGLAAWLRQNVPGDFYVRVNPNNEWYEAALSNRLRLIEPWYPLGELQQSSDDASQRSLRALPNYLIQPSDQPLTGYLNPSLVQQMEGYSLYNLPHSLPYVFSVSQPMLNQGSQAGELSREDVVPQTWVTTGPNTLETIAAGNTGDHLAVMTTDYPGWQVRVDGQKQPLKSLDGFVALEMLPGVHKYEFAFRPASFYSGFLISLISLGAILYLAASDSRAFWQRFLARLRALPGRLRALPERLRAFPVKWRDWWGLRTASWVAGKPLVTEAVYRQGALHPDASLSLPEETHLRLVLEADALARRPVGLSLTRWWWATQDLLRAIAGRIPFEVAIFTTVIAIYLITRLVALDRFPIYFMADEASQTLYAQQLVEQGFRDRLGILFPIYVEAAGGRWTPLISMYLHAVTFVLFGKSVFITRATSALVSLLAVISVALILKNIFKARYWWVGALLLSISPAWLLHSRTGFETVMTTAFYGCFLYFYLLYRTKDPRYIIHTLVCGALTFYTYSNAQVVMAAAGALLLISDFSYHLKNWRVLLKALPVGLVVLLPLLIFRYHQPDALTNHLHVVNSYWYTNISLSEKVTTYLGKLAYGLSPQYWFLPNGQDLARHRFDSMGHIRLEVLPLVLAGLALSVKNFRQSPYRAVLIAALVTPAGAALLDIGIPRVLAFVVPASILAGLGLNWALVILEKYINYKVLSIAALVVLAVANFSLFRIALTQGPLWFSDYGLYGMQYGAQQLFEGAIPDYLAQYPSSQLIISPNWANATDRFLDFFVTPEQRQEMSMGSIEGYLFKRLPLEEKDVFIMTAPEYEKAVTSPKFSDISVDKVLDYPNGAPGFYFVRLRYSDEADQIFAAEKEARKELVTNTVELGGQEVELHYSQIDMGEPSLMFDGDHLTLMRGLEANPFILEIVFPSPRSFSGVEADFGVADLTLTAMLYADVNSEPVVYSTELSNTDVDPSMKIKFDQGPQQVSKIRFEVLNRSSGETANIHIKELNLQP
jgi:hypothetical protein